jgi:DNA-3-methyladenine glycosylase II
MMTGMPRRLTERSLLGGVRTLAADHPELAASVERFGPPPLWAREPSFATLVHLILEQQVSLASALAAFERLRIATGDVTPDAFLTLDDRALREIGFSRQKAGYARDLAVALTDGFDLAGLERLADDEVRSSLMRFRGIGRWTADVYLTMCLLRPDVWPHGDQALATGAMELLELPTRPAFDELEVLAERWRPLRAVGARIIWHHYLGVRDRLESRGHVRPPRRIDARPDRV